MKKLILNRTLFFVFFAGIVWGQIPQTMSYQGILKTSSGTVVTDGNYQLTFNLYDVSTSGTTLWTETHTTVAVSDGVFNVILGSITTLNLAFDEQYWLGVTVSTDSELSPRVKLTASPYSLNALAVLGSSNSFPSSGSVGIGTVSPTAALELYNTDDTDAFKITSSASSASDWAFYHDVAGDASLDVKDGIGNTVLSMIAGTSQNGMVAIGYTTSSGKLVVNGDVGIGTTSPAQKLDIAGTAQMSGFKLTTTPTSGYVLTADASGVGTWQAAASGVGGSGTTNYLPKFTDSSTLGNSVIYESSGDVGIGTTSPSASLEIFKNGGQTNFANSPATLQLTQDTDNNSPMLRFKHTGTGGYMWTLGQYPPNSGNQFVITDDVGTSVFSIATNGKVGIGTTSPGNLLHLSADDATNSGVSDMLRIEHTTTGTAATGIGTGITFHVEDGGGSEEQGSIDVILDDVTNTTEDATMTFNINQNGAMTEVMRIDGTNGYVGIGTTSPAQPLHINTSTSRPLYVERTGGSGSTQGSFEVMISEISPFPVAADAILRSGSNRDIALQSNDGNGGTLIITSAGNVGIGIVTPTQELTVAGDVVIGSGTSDTETLANTGFSLGGDDLFVAGDAGVEGAIYTDGGVKVGASTAYADGSITKSSGNFTVSLGGSAGDDLIVDTNTLVVESDNNRVGIGTTSPNSTFETNGSFATSAIATVTANYTITATDYLIVANNTVSISLTLPTAVGINGRKYIIKKTGTGAISVDIYTTSSQTIDGSSTALLMNQWAWVEVISDGTNWLKIGSG